MGFNAALKARMDALGLTQLEMAERMNDELEKTTGRRTFTERTVYNLLTGKTRWPHTNTRRALEEVFGYPVEQLGFTPPGANRPKKPEHPVRRRTFLTSATGTAAAAAVPTLSRPHSVGASDVLRVRAGLDRLGALEQRRGGHAELESAALTGTRKALELQQGSASDRIRRRLFTVAAEYTAIAAWSAIDAREFDRAHRHLDRCLTFAGLAQDSTAQLQTWNAISVLSRHQRRHTDGLAAAEAAQRTGITRRDPFFRSLAHARTALAHSARGDRQSALRSLGCAHEALSKAQHEPRPGWAAFYGEAELYALTSIVHDRLGDAAQSESASHRALTIIPAHFRRNRALATSQLALAQLHQGDAEQACATADRVFALMAGDPLPARLRSLIGDFHRELMTVAPGRLAKEWSDRTREEWSRA